MKQLLKGIKLTLLGGLLALANTPIAALEATPSDPGLDYFYPYAGVDVRWQQTKGKSDWNKVLVKSYPSGTLYFGERFDTNWGVEFGYTQTTARKHKHNFTGDTFFNAQNTNGAQTTVKTMFRSGHADLNIYYPLGCLELIGSLGGGLIKPKIRFAVSNPGPYTGFFAQNAASLATTRVKTKGFVRLGAGAQYLFNEVVGIRGMLRWESTSFLKAEGHYNLPHSTIHSLRKIFKDSYSVSLGLFFKFS